MPSLVKLSNSILSTVARTSADIFKDLGGRAVKNYAQTGSPLSPSLRSSPIMFRSIVPPSPTGSPIVRPLAPVALRAQTTCDKLGKEQPEYLSGDQRVNRNLILRDLQNYGFDVDELTPEAMLCLLALQFKKTSGQKRRRV